MNKKQIYLLLVAIAAAVALLLSIYTFFGDSLQMSSYSYYVMALWQSLLMMVSYVAAATAFITIYFDNDKSPRSNIGALVLSFAMIATPTVGMLTGIFPEALSWTMPLLSAVTLVGFVLLSRSLRSCLPLLLLCLSFPALDFFIQLVWYFSPASESYEAMVEYSCLIDTMSIIELTSSVLRVCFFALFAWQYNKFFE